MMKKLFAGFWIGEFGWELMGWQAYIRAISKYYDEIIIGCRPENKFLYENFATGFYEFCIDYKDANQWMNDPVFYDTDKLIHEYRKARYDILRPNEVWNPLRSKSRFYVYDLQPQEFIKYGDPLKLCAKQPKILFHVRNRSGIMSRRNWKIEHAELLAKQFKLSDIACIGTKNDSLCLKNTMDLRDVNLEILCNNMASADIIFSPQSGVIHLATLCGLPQITWTHTKWNIDRVLKHWNPFNVKAVNLYNPDQSWQPPVEDLLREYEKLI